jgi:tRNA (cmo5U34)-methyltransferase
MSEWQSADHASAYLERADRVPNRSAGEAALIDELPPHVRRVLDLGSGDGRLLEMVLDARPHARGVALDFSPLMLQQLKARFAARPDLTVEVVDRNLETELPSLGTFDVVVSSFALHHLLHERKRRLYEEIWDLLEPGGVFCNLEHVASASAYGHERFLQAMGTTPAEEDPSNKLLDVQSQLRWLREIGFADVDCYWKWRELALLVGRKHAAEPQRGSEGRSVTDSSAAAVEMSAVAFRHLRADEVDRAHEILVRAAERLLSKGIRQWTVDYPKDRYLASQEMGWNYALEVEGELAAVLTLSRELPAVWADHFGAATPVWWLSKLATAPAFHGRGVGALAVRCAMGAAYNQGADRLCLDCVYGNGFLVDFYRGLGFRLVDRRDVQFPTGLFDMALMELQMLYSS